VLPTISARISLMPVTSG